MSTVKILQGVDDLRAIWKRHPALEYLKSKNRKAETAKLWVSFTNAERLEVIHLAYSN